MNIEIVALGNCPKYETEMILNGHYLAAPAAKIKLRSCLFYKHKNKIKKKNNK